MATKTQKRTNRSGSSKPSSSRSSNRSRPRSRSKSSASKADASKHNRADARAPIGAGGTGPQGGVVDNMTRRNDGEALQGQFARIDLNHKDVPKDLRESGRDYGVYLEPAEVDSDGYPVTARVRLRDATNATVVVPYESLRPAEAGGRL